MNFSWVECHASGPPILPHWLLWQALPSLTQSKRNRLVIHQLNIKILSQLWVYIKMPQVTLLLPLPKLSTLAVDSPLKLWGRHQCMYVERILWCWCHLQACLEAQPHDPCLGGPAACPLSKVYTQNTHTFIKWMWIHMNLSLIAVHLYRFNSLVSTSF